MLLKLSINAEDFLKRETTSFVFTEIKPSRVLKILSKLDVAKATRLDQVCNKVHKLAPPVIYRKTDLFNLSLRSREFSDDWKLAKVSPVRIQINISVSTISRVFEKLVYKWSL